MHGFYLYSLVWNNELGIYGVAYAGILTNTQVYLSLMIYTYSLRSIKEAVHLPDKSMFMEIKQYLLLGLPSVFNILTEQWSFEIMAFMVGYIGVK